MKELEKILVCLAKDGLSVEGIALLRALYAFLSSGNCSKDIEVLRG